MCKTCGKTFTRTHNPRRINKYCSLQCMGKNDNKRLQHSETMKGRTAWNKGHAGRKPWMNTSGLRPGWNKGQPNLKMVGNQHAKGSIPWNKNKTLPEWVKEKLSKAHMGKTGKLAGNWKGGLTGINNLIRGSLENKKWSRSVLERDKFECQSCGIIGGKLNAHHIKPFAIFPALRFAIDNGITLCIDCHHEIHTIERTNKSFSFA